MKMSEKLQKWISVLLVLVVCFTFSGIALSPNVANAAVTDQSIIPAVEAWPNIPSSFHIRDWTKTANDFYDLAFDENAKGKDLPILKTFTVDHPSQGGFTGLTFGMPSYMKDSWGLGDYASHYSIQVSSDAVQWKDVFKTTDGKGGTENIAFASKYGRYVRLKLDKGIGDKFEVSAIEVFGKYKGKDLAYQKKAFASSNNGIDFAGNVTSGLLTQEWYSKTAMNEWIYVDLGSTQTIRSVKIIWTPGYGEGVATLPAVLGASLMGKDMTDYQNKNWVKMIDTYYSKTAAGRGFISNNPAKSDSTDSFWYDLYPTILYSQIAALYPKESSIQKKMMDVNNSWLAALKVLDNNWNHQGFSFKNMNVQGTDHLEPDAVIGVAYLEYMAYVKTGETKYLDAATKCMTQANQFQYNPLFEVVGSYGPYVAARMNAETGSNYQISKFMNWVFSPSSDTRSGWGTITGKWGEYDANGLLGSTTDTGGYAFAMNTFVTAGQMAPVARYAPEYSKSIAKYLLQVANNAVLFYPDGLPGNMQNNYALAQEDHFNSIAYEGVRNKGETQPYATGDAPDYFGIYSSTPVGLFSSIIHKTNVPEILQIDLLKTDFNHRDAYPTYLYYNPLAAMKQVTIDVGKVKKDLYDSVTKSFIATGVKGKTTFALGADQAAQIVVVPTHGKVTLSGNKIQINGKTVTYQNASISINGYSDGQEVSGTIPLSIGIGVPNGDSLKKVTLDLSGTLVFTGSSLPAGFSMDTSLYESGKKTLNVTIETVKGVKYSSCIDLNIRNVLGEKVLSASADEMVLWICDGITVTKDVASGNALFSVKPENTWGPATSNSFALDFDRQPLLSVDVISATRSWGVKLVIEDLNKDFYIQGDTAVAGMQKYDLQNILASENVTGPHQVQIMIFVSGGLDAMAQIKSVEVQHMRKLP